MSKRKAKDSPAASSAGLRLGIWRRRKLLAAAFVVIIAAFLARQVWRTVEQSVADSPRYRVTESTIRITPLPPWIRSDVKHQSLQNAGIELGFSMLSPPPKLESRLADALLFHPWVREVKQVSRRSPNEIWVELSYREPVAAVQLQEDPQKLWPVDAEGVRLPARDLSEAELHRMPRIVDIKGAPLEGEPWDDPRVEGALALITRLAPYWNSLDLIRVTPNRTPIVRGGRKYASFELLAQSGTRINWGAAPELGPSDEPPFEAKLDRLKSFIAENGPLNSLPNAPEWIDVQYVLEVRALTVRAPSDETLR